ncbi:MAG TPA: hypothetical protein VF516_22840 [Kofleriaceae bacterium]
MTTALEHRSVLDDETRGAYIRLWILKKLDLPPDNGGMTFPVVLPAELSPLDSYLQDLAVEGLVAINSRKGRYELTKQGIAYLGAVIDEASDLLDDLDELETEEAIAELRARGLDVYRARFLWGWFQGEFDDLVLFQERRGIMPVERMWAFYLTGDEFWRELANELTRAEASE